MTPYVWANGNSVDGFFDMVSMVLLIGRWCYPKEWEEFKDKILLYCFREVKCKQFSLQGLDINHIRV